MNKQAMKAVEKGSLGGFMKAHYPVRETNPMKDESKNLPRNKKRSEENKKKFEEVAKRMKPFRHSEKLMLDTHLSEMARRRAEGYNVGWASGKDFISSKTSKGRLHTTHSRGSYNHEWEER